MRSDRHGHPVVTREVAGSSPAAPAIEGDIMENYIIQEYNRKTKKYRDLGAIMASNKEEAKAKYLEVSSWTPNREILLHAEPSSSFKVSK